jgi:endonuclease/exonuclease/phosphatase (EEP) superfamily protein YafD
MWVMWTSAAALLLIATAALVSRFLPAVNRAVLLTAALSPYLMLGAPIAAALFAGSGCRPAAFIAAAVTVAALATQLPFFLGRRAPRGPTLRFVTANLRYGQADPAAVAQLAQQHADVLAVQELTPELADELSALLAAAFPFTVLRPGERATGVGVWSRHRMLGTGIDEDFQRGFITAHIQVPGISVPATVVCTHLSPPRSAFRHWRADIERLGPALARLPADGPVVVGCDLNATADVREFRALLRDGYADGAAQAGAGFLRTHPDDLPIPRIVAVDHVLTRAATVTDIRAVRVPGSDHRALVATVVLGQS